MDFHDSEIGFFMMSDTNGRQEIYAEILLLVNLYYRAVSLAKDISTVRDPMISVLVLDYNIDEILEQRLGDYADDLGIKEINLIRGADGKSKKGMSMIVNFDQTGHKPIFQHRGFGTVFSGKKIDLPMAIFELAVLNNIMSKAKKDKKVERCLYQFGHIISSEKIPGVKVIRNGQEIAENLAIPVL